MSSRIQIQNLLNNDYELLKSCMLFLFDYYFHFELF